MYSYSDLQENPYLNLINKANGLQLSKGYILAYIQPN